MNYNEIELILKDNPNVVAKIRFDKSKGIVANFYSVMESGGMEIQNQLADSEVKALLRKAIK